MNPSLPNSVRRTVSARSEVLQCLATGLVLLGLLCLPQIARAAANPTPAEVAAALDASARKHRIPTILLEGLAWRESRWRQWDAATGQPVEAETGHVGLLGVWDGKRADADWLRSDWRYNVEEGARQLELCWYRAPIVGNGRLDDGRNILESWYFALGRYGDGRQSDAANRFAETVLDAVGQGGDGRWRGVPVSRPAPEKLAWGRNVFGPPVPWHFGDVTPVPPARVVVALNVPYLSQVYDSPDNFNGSGSCGPTSMVMVLACMKKVAPQPTLVTDAYRHETPFGGLIPGVHERVCEPNVGAVHAKMLDYLRPYFPGVAIFYNERATLKRVRAELDAGRPVILGTEVTPAGHIMVARGYLSDGRLLVNDPAGDYYQAARRDGPHGGYSPTGSRYWNGDGDKAIYDWDALSVRWIMTVGPTSGGADRPEDG